MKKQLTSKTIKISSLRPNQIHEMFAIFEKFYDNVSLDRFKSDLSNKSRVILLLTQKKEIKGFSTLDEFDLDLHNKNYRILYSGDTIISSEYWGTPVLTLAFLKYMTLLKLRFPTRPVWWFLISKGYKTYLLLANNFLNYYPRLDKETPNEHKDLIAALSEKIYPGKFNHKTGIIEFRSGEHEKLKEYVAPITKELKTKYPKIAFFDEQNPNWKNGDELSCIGEVDPALAILHPLKIFKKMILKNKIFQKNNP